MLKLINSVQEAIESANKLRTKPLPVPDITPSLLSPLGAPLPLHVSLSRTLQIKTENRDSFVRALTAALHKSQARPFDVRFTSLKWVPNYERNRWFLVLGIEKPPNDDLNRLLVACNAASESSGYPGLYTGGSGDGPMEDNTSADSLPKRRKTSQPKSPGEATVLKNDVDFSNKFHISIAWNLVEPAPEWISLAGEVDVAKLVHSPTSPLDAVKARIGNTVHSISLANKPSTAAKGGGRSGLLGLG